MADGGGLVIPIKGQNFAKGLFESFNMFSEYIVSKTKKSEEDTQKAKSEYKKWRKENQDLFEQFVNSQENPATKKMRKKLLQTYYKVFVANKFFKKLGNMLKNIWKQLSAVGTSLFVKILKFLLIMAIIDPKGKLFGSLLKIAINILSMLLQMIAKWLPVIIKTMFNLVTKVIPTILKDVMPKLLKAFSDMFFTLGREFAKTNPVLGDLFNSLGKLLQSKALFYWWSYNCSNRLFTISLGICRRYCKIYGKCFY
jgi:hypothetical protein